MIDPKEPEAEMSESAQVAELAEAIPEATKNNHSTSELGNIEESVVPNA